MTDLVEGMFILMCAIHGMGVLVEGMFILMREGKEKRVTSVMSLF